MATYEITVNKLSDVLGEIKAAGLGEMFVVIGFEGGGPMPITAILNAPVVAQERWGDRLMSEEEAKSAADDTPQVICLQAPQMSPCGWLSRELKAKAASEESKQP